MARKSNFDKEHKLIEAMQLFWQKGYASTSVADLVETLGINRFSLYNTYGDKQALYYLALDHYLQNISFPSMHPLIEADADLDTLKEFFMRFAGIQKEQTGGCFMQNALIEHAAEDETVFRHVQALFELLLTSFTRALNNAQAKKQINADINSEDLAALLLTQVQGIRILGKARQYDAIERSLKVMLSLLN